MGGGGSFAHFGLPPHTGLRFVAGSGVLGHCLSPMGSGMGEEGTLWGPAGARFWVGVELLGGGSQCRAGPEVVAAAPSHPHVPPGLPAATPIPPQSPPRPHSRLLSGWPRPRASSWHPLAPPPPAPGRIRPHCGSLAGAGLLLAAPQALGVSPFFFPFFWVFSFLSLSPPPLFCCSRRAPRALFRAHRALSAALGAAARGRLRAGTGPGAASTGRGGARGCSNAPPSRFGVTSIPPC